VEKQKPVTEAHRGTYDQYLLCAHFCSDSATWTPQIAIHIWILFVL